MPRTSFLQISFSRALNFNVTSYGGNNEDSRTQPSPQTSRPFSAESIHLLYFQLFMHIAQSIKFTFSNFLHSQLFKLFLKNLSRVMWPKNFLLSPFVLFSALNLCYLKWEISIPKFSSLEMLNEENFLLERINDWPGIVDSVPFTSQIIDLECILICCNLTNVV